MDPQTMNQAVNPMPSPDTVLDHLRARVYGQAEALAPVVRAYTLWSAGLAGLDKPVSAFLMLGPTGVGKTLTVEALAEILHGDSRKMIKVHCAEYRHSHEVSRLIGAPPGYIGHKETAPRLSQRKILEARSRDCPLVLVLFDEIEKAHPDLWDLLLGVLDKGELHLGDGSAADLRQCMVFLTSNVGAREAAGAAGFRSQPRQTAEGAARRLFSPEFRNRLTATLSYRALTGPDMGSIAGLELERCATRLRDSQGLFLSLDRRVAGMMAEACHRDTAFGARPMRRAIEELLELPVAHLLLEGRVRTGDEVTVAVRRGHLVLERMDSL
jgi:ATP-dependent Clp protease ATP-binding subunit ClpA